MAVMGQVLDHLPNLKHFEIASERISRGCGIPPDPFSSFLLLLHRFEEDDSLWIGGIGEPSSPHSLRIGPVGSVVVASVLVVCGQCNLISHWLSAGNKGLDDKAAPAIQQLVSSLPNLKTLNLWCNNHPLAWVFVLVCDFVCVVVCCCRVFSGQCHSKSVAGLPSTPPQSGGVECRSQLW